MNAKLHVVSAAALCLALCTCDERRAAVPDRGAPNAPTWSADVAPLVTRHCVSCHREGELAPFALTSYAAAKPRASAMARAVRDRQMPPWGARESAACTPPMAFRGDPRLTPQEIDVFETWARAGAPEGEPGHTAAVPAAPTTSLADPSFEAAPRIPFVLQEDRDRFVCVVLEPAIDHPTWITGIAVVPGDRRIVHHAVALADPDGALAKQADADGRFECAGVPAGSAFTSVLAVWLPGSQPVEFPTGAAMPVPAGTKIVLQMHYSAAARLGSEDATRVALRMSDAKPKYLVHNAAWGNSDRPLPGGDGLQPGPADEASGPQFFVPAGARDHEETMLFTVPAPPDGVASPEARILGVMPHAHFAAVRITATLERGATTSCLVDDEWDAHWQRLYAYDAPLDALPPLLPGDRVRIRCRYDNTLDNPRLASALAERRLPLRDIGYGERTTDEMCAVFPQLVFRLQE